MQQLVKEICESYDPIKDGMVVNAVTGHQEDAQEQINRIVGLLDAPQFQKSPPFTLQRMAELLTEPFKFYPQNQLAKFLRALERVMLVSSSIDDYGQVSVDIHDVPTVEDGEKIKPDTGIVLTPIPWITEADTAKLERAGDETDADTADDQEEGVKPVPKDEGGEEGVQSDIQSTAQEPSNVSVEMADVSGDTSGEIAESIAMASHDVSVEMTDADLSAEMAAHDVPDDVAQDIRQAKSEEAQGDLLTTVVADVTHINDIDGKHGETERSESTEKAEKEKEAVAEVSTGAEETTETTKETTAETTSEGEPQTEQNGSATAETEEDREAKRLKTE